MQAHLLPSYDLERVASTRRGRARAPLRVREARIRPPLLAPGGAFREGNPAQQACLKQETAKLADGFQRSRANVEGRHGYLSLRNHARRGLDSPRKRAGLTAVPTVLLPRSDGTTAAERLFGQKPRSMFAALLASV